MVLSKAFASTDFRRRHLQAAAKEYKLALDLFLRMKGSGTLPPHYVPMGDELPRLIAEAEAAAAALNGGAPR
jgi:hypothetical protein